MTLTTDSNEANATVTVGALFYMLERSLFE